MTQKTNEFRIVNGPDIMSLMLGLFDGKECYFALEYHSNKRDFLIDFLKREDAYGSYWTIGGTILDPRTTSGYEAHVPFTASYKMNGGRRTGTLTLT